MKIEIHCGRGRDERSPEFIEVVGFKGLMEAVQQRLMSKIVSIVQVFDELGKGTGTYRVVVGDTERDVGYVKILDFREEAERRAS